MGELLGTQAGGTAILSRRVPYAALMHAALTGYFVGSITRRSDHDGCRATENLPVMTVAMPCHRHP